MYHIGILAKEGRSLSVTHSEIKRSTFFKPRIFMNSFTMVKALKEETFSAFIIITDEFKPSHIRIIKQVKQQFLNLPVIVITDKPSIAAKIKLVDFKKTILLNLKTEVKDMNGIILKLINDIHVIPRLANRYRTAQPARFKIESSRVHSAFMLDIARDGACFRLFNKRVSRGDQIQIEVPLPDLKKTHIVQGQVVWERIEKLKNEATASSQKVGIKFL